MRHFNFLILFFMSMTLHADVYEENCKNCHFQQRQMQMFMSRYTLKYSSEERIKQAIFDFLKDPKEGRSVMPLGFLSRWGVKEKTALSDKELKFAIDRYFDEYNLKRLFK